MTFNPQEYWETRLTKSFNLNGVGDIGLGKKYNDALYNVREYVFFEIVKNIKVDFSTKKIMDIGSGTGFYIERWNKLGVQSLLGTDITKVVVENLSKKYNYADFRQLDIGQSDVSSFPKVDFISAFDVLFHIVDDERFEQAIQNVAKLLNKDGYFIISDNFVRGRTIRVKHQVSRSNEYMMQVIEEAGFELVDSKPMFVLMNTPIDSESRMLKRLNYLLEKSVRKGEGYGRFIGKLLLPIEKLLISMMKEGPSTEVKLFKKV